jgi:hypothetical protein
MEKRNKKRMEIEEGRIQQEKIRAHSELLALREQSDQAVRKEVANEYKAYLEQQRQGKAIVR